MSEHCDFGETTAHQRHKGIGEEIVKRLDRAPSLPEFDADDISAVGGPLGIVGDGEGSSAGSSSNQRHVVHW